MAFVDHYYVLGVAFGATPDAIKAAYRSRAKQWHPDVNKTPGAIDRFTVINTAWEVLGDERKKVAYDALYVQMRPQARATSHSNPPYTPPKPQYRPQPTYGPPKPKQAEKPAPDPNHRDDLKLTAVARSQRRDKDKDTLSTRRVNKMDTFLEFSCKFTCPDFIGNVVKEIVYNDGHEETLTIKWLNDKRKNDSPREYWKSLTSCPLHVLTWKRLGAFQFRFIRGNEQAEFVYADYSLFLPIWESSPSYTRWASMLPFKPIDGHSDYTWIEWISPYLNKPTPKYETRYNQDYKPKSNTDQMNGDGDTWV